MVEDYIQTISEKLIKDNGYLLVNNPMTYGGFSRKRAFFMKNAGNGFVVLEVYNLVQYGYQELKSEIQNKEENLRKIYSSPVEYRIFKIFISDDEVSNEIIDLIKGVHFHQESMRKFVKPLYVNLNSGDINCYFNKHFPDDGILTVLAQNLNKENWIEYDEKRIKEVNLEKQKDYRVTIVSTKSIAVYTIIALNILVYVVAKLKCYMFNINYFDVMNDFGLMDGRLIKKGEYFRLLSPIFLHGSLIHLFINCFSFSAIGPICEKMYGNLKFLFIYLLSGIGGCIFSFALSGSLSLGASGAIFGVVGALMYFGLQKPVAFRAMFDKSLIVVTLVNLAIGLFISGIDNMGHIGGLIAGFLLAGVFKYLEDDKIDIRKICLLLIVVIFGGMLFIGFRF